MSVAIAASSLAWARLAWVWLRPPLIIVRPWFEDSATHYVFPNVVLRRAANARASEINPTNGFWSKRPSGASHIQNNIINFRCFSNLKKETALNKWMI